MGFNKYSFPSRTPWDTVTKEGDSPVRERSYSPMILILKYRGTRETLWESARTILARLNTSNDR